MNAEKLVEIRDRHAAAAAIANPAKPLTETIAACKQPTPEDGKCVCPLIPESVVLCCKACAHVWIQTVGYALSAPMDICRCPKCSSPWQIESPAVHRCSCSTEVLLARGCQCGGK